MLIDASELFLLDAGQHRARRRDRRGPRRDLEGPPPGRPRGELARVIDSVVLTDLITLSRTAAASPQTRAIATLALQNLRTWAATAAPRAQDLDERAHLAYADQQLTALQKDPQLVIPAPALPPDGPPIGSPFGTLDDDDERRLPGRSHATMHAWLCPRRVSC